uniref:Elongin BC and polycomb repressive complex 2 associated protein n=1 Tax=Pseudonaja textilis TaxID=8673 RepID=A0A670Z7U1_PSETE
HEDVCSDPESPVRPEGAAHSQSHPVGANARRQVFAHFQDRPGGPLHLLQGLNPQEEEEEEESQKEGSRGPVRSAPTRHARSVGPSERPQPKNGGVRESLELGVQEGEEADFLSIPDRVRAGERDKTEEAALQQTSEEGSGRGAHFDRLIRQSKLWCYAKGFNVDGKVLRRAEQAKGCPPTSKGRPPKIPRKKTPKGGAPPCKRLLSTAPGPVRNPFTLMGTFPCTPALVVGSDGDLCPASSLCVKDSCILSKTHPLWTWQLGGHAIPMPPSLKFRGYGFENV